MQQDRIKPQTWTIGGFFSSSHLAAADVQRDYQWTKSEVATLENKTKRLSDTYLDLDLLDSQARDVLGLIRSDEIVLQ